MSKLLNPLMLILALAVLIPAATQANGSDSSIAPGQIPAASLSDDLKAQIRSGLNMLHTELSGKGGSVEPFEESMLATPSTISSSDVILDVSEGSKRHIPGTINISYGKFIKESKLLPVPEVSKILGDAGITRNDSIVVFGECLPCGGGPAASTYMYWVLKYLGQERVRVLEKGNKSIDGDLPAGTPNYLPNAVYIPRLHPEILATFDEASNHSIRVVDARLQSEYNSSHIPNAISLPYEMVLDGNVTKPVDQLDEIFSDAGLSKDRPVIVYTDTGIKASVVWFGLELLGYDAKLYSVQAWNEHMKSAG
jgi:thiosulfate/3-mercaptopyruvate sulfurtransferase